MKRIDIFQQIGVILLSFSIYDLIYGEWKPIPFAPSIKPMEFSFEKALAILFIIMILIASIVLESKRLNYIMLGRSDESDDVVPDEQRNLNRLKNPAMLKNDIYSSALGLSAAVSTYIAMGWKQLFLVTVGLTLINWSFVEERSHNLAIKS